MVLTDSPDDPENLGAQERYRHVERIRAGAPCFMVMCRPKDPEAALRVIGDFDENDIFVGGAMRDTPPNFRFPPRTNAKAIELASGGGTWVLVTGRKPMDSLKPSVAPKRG